MRILGTTIEVSVPMGGDLLQLVVIVRQTGFQWVGEPLFHI